MKICNSTYSYLLIPLIFTIMGLTSCESTERKDLKLLEEGKVLFFNQDYKTSQIKFEKASLLNPKNDVASAYWGFSSLYLKEYTTAMNAFNKSLLYNPRNNIALFGKGLWLFQMEDFLGAQILFDSVCKINPQHDKAFYYKALTSLKFNDTLSAQFELKQAIDNAPDYTEPYYLLASIFLANQQKQVADSLIHLASANRRNIATSP